MSVQDQVFDKIAETMGLDRATLTPESTFSQIGADSLDMVEFSMDLEDLFNITINQADIGGIKTIGQAIEFIEKNKK